MSLRLSCVGPRARTLSLVHARALGDGGDPRNKNTTIAQGDNKPHNFTPAIEDKTDGDVAKQYSAHRHNQRQSPAVRREHARRPGGGLGRARLRGAGDHDLGRLRA